MNLTRLEIRCPDGTTNNAEILLDGKKLDTVVRVAFDLAPNKTVIARLEVLADLTVDAALRERVFEKVDDSEGE